MAESPRFNRPGVKTLINLFSYLPQNMPVFIRQLNHSELDEWSEEGNFTISMAARQLQEASHEPNCDCPMVLPNENTAYQLITRVELADTKYGPACVMVVKPVNPLEMLIEFLAEYPRQCESGEFGMLIEFLTH